MSFWSYFGLTCLLGALFGGNKQSHKQAQTPRYDPVFEAELDDRYDTLSERVDELESRLDDIDCNSEQYDDLRDEIQSLRDELDEIASERENYGGY